MADNQTDATSLERFAKSIGGTFAGFGENNEPIIDMGLPDATGQKPTLDSLYLQDSENMQVLSHPDPDLPPVPTAANFNTRTEPGGRTFGQRLIEAAQTVNNAPRDFVRNYGNDILKSVPWALFDSVANFARNSQMESQAAAPQTKPGVDTDPNKGGVQEGSNKAALDENTEQMAKVTAYFEELAKPFTPQTGVGRFTGEVVRYGAPAVAAMAVAPEVAAPMWGARVLNWGSKFLAGAMSDAAVGYFADDPRRSIQASTRGVTDDQLAEAGIMGSAVGLMRKMTSFLALPDEAFDDKGEIKDASWEEARKRMAGEQVLLNPVGEALMLGAKALAKGIRGFRAAGIEDEVINAGEKARNAANDREALDPSLITRPDRLQQALRDGEALGYVTKIMRDIRPATTADVVDRYDQAFKEIERVVDTVAPIANKEQRMAALLKRRQKEAQGLPVAGAPKNERLELPGPGNQPPMVLGKLTHDDWIARTETVLNDAEIDAAARWYADAMKPFINELGLEDGAKAYVGWLAANKNTSPTQAMVNYLKIVEQVNRGIPLERLKQGGLMGIDLYKWLQGDQLGGVGLKLRDFIDSGLQRTTRSTYDHIEEAGAPFVVDKHTARDTGYVDNALLAELQRGGYLSDLKMHSNEKGNKWWTAVNANGEPIRIEDDLTAVTQGEVKSSPPSDQQYEAAGKWGRDLTDELNRRAWRGRTDWTPAEIQAIGWTAMSRVANASGETPFDSMASVTSRVSMAAGPGAGSPWEKTFGERWGALPMMDQQEITAELTTEAMRIAKDLVGNIEGIPVHGRGGWAGQLAEPSAVAHAVTTPDAAEAYGRVIGYLLNQSEVWMTRLWSGMSPAASGRSKANGLGLTLVGEGLKDAQVQEAVFARLHALDPNAFPGFQPYRNADGEPGLLLLTRPERKLTDAEGAGAAVVQGVKRTESAPEAFARTREELQQKAQAMIQQVADELGIDVKAGVVNADIRIAGNDWTQRGQKNGQGYLGDALGKVIGKPALERLVGDHRKELDQLLDQAIREREGRTVVRKRAIQKSDRSGGEGVDDAAFPTESEAQRASARLTRQTGKPHVAVPTEDGRWQVIPYEPAQARVDPEGRELRALMIFGDEPAKAATVLHLARILASDVNISAGRNKLGTDQGSMTGTQQGSRRAVKEIMIGRGIAEPERTLGHETGHAISWLTWAEDHANVPVLIEATELSKLRRPWLWDDANFPGREDKVEEYRAGADELMADALEAYMRDPEQAKRVAPELTKFLRKMINENPRLRDIVQFLGIGALLLPMAKGGDDGES